MLTLADRPYRLLNDEQVLINIQNCNHALLIPAYANDLADLMLSCWKKSDTDRPSFAQINQFFIEKQSNDYQQID